MIHVLIPRRGRTNRPCLGMSVLPARGSSLPRASVVKSWIYSALSRPLFSACPSLLRITDATHLQFHFIHVQRLHLRTLVLQVACPHWTLCLRSAPAIPGQASPGSGQPTRSSRASKEPTRPRICDRDPCHVDHHDHQHQPQAGPPSQNGPTRQSWGGETRSDCRWVASGRRR